MNTLRKQASSAYQISLRQSNMIKAGGKSKQIVSSSKMMFNSPVTFEYSRGQNYLSLCKEGASKRVDENHFQLFCDFSETGEPLKPFIFIHKLM